MKVKYLINSLAEILCRCVNTCNPAQKTLPFIGEWEKSKQKAITNISTVKLVQLNSFISISINLDVYFCRNRYFTIYQPLCKNSDSEICVKLFCFGQSNLNHRILFNWKLDVWQQNDGESSIGKIWRSNYSHIQNARCNLMLSCFNAFSVRCLKRWQTVICM